MRHYWWIFILALGLAGCGSKDPKQLTYRIARDPTWYPLDMEGKEPYVYGFSDDLLELIANSENLRFHLLPANWESLEIGLAQNSFDGMLTSLLPVAEAADFYSFSEPYLLLGPTLVMPNDTTVTTLDQLEGKIVAVEPNSPSLMLAAKYPLIVIHPYDSMAAALDDLVHAKVDAVLLPYLIAQGYCRDLYQGVLKIVAGPMGPEGLRLLTLKKRALPLVPWFNQGLEKAMQEGSYQTLREKWSLN